MPCMARGGGVHKVASACASEPMAMVWFPNGLGAIVAAYAASEQLSDALII